MHWAFHLILPRSLSSNGTCSYHYSRVLRDLNLQIDRQHADRHARVPPADRAGTQAGARAPALPRGYMYFI